MILVNKIENLIQNSSGVCKAIGGVVKVIAFSTLKTRFYREIVRSSDEIVVLGNGPSLKNFLEFKGNFLEDKEVFCVNFSVESEYFEILKPRFYIATDPAVFNDKDFAKRLFGGLAEKTNWELNLFVPYRFKNGSWVKYLQENGRIKIHYINTTPVEGTFDICKGIYRKKLGMPRPQNILVPALMVSLWSGFKIIYTAGVEHSWHNQIWVNDNNELMINDVHFYDDNKDKVRRHGSFDMSSLLYRLAAAFNSYSIVEKFSRTVNARIYNITEGSFIDAFERKKI
ncbi:MAG: hypothetical protein LIO79_07360 [Rikenellaceae bacterium]|nr:hypothetical protein [Rikenellaceae bacterium]